MVQQLIRSKKVSDDIVEQLEHLILEGIFKPGSRLPAERKLAEEFGVSRPSVREALKKMVAKGLVISRQGGGNFVVESVGQLFRDPILSLYGDYPDAQRDLLEFRHTLEASCAYYAALRANKLDLENLVQQFNVMKACYLDKQSTKNQEAEADAGFHLAIAEASHNMVLLQIMRMLFDLVKQNITSSIFCLYTGCKQTRDQLMEQHTALYEAILSGDAELAKMVAGDHINYVRQVLDELERDQKRIVQSERRHKSETKKKSASD